MIRLIHKLVERMLNMTFKVGDKVRCIRGSLFNEIQVDEVYTVSKVTTSDNGKELIELEEDFNGAWLAERFVIHYGEDTSTNSYNTSLGVVYGILYNSIKDTKEDLWMIAENIAEALGEVEDKL